MQKEYVTPTTQITWFETCDVIRTSALIKDEQNDDLFDLFGGVLEQ